MLHSNNMLTFVNSFLHQDEIFFFEYKSVMDQQKSDQRLKLLALIASVILLLSGGGRTHLSLRPGFFNHLITHS